MPAPLLIEEMESTDAKNRFGEAMAAARAGRAVSIKWHGKPAAYLIPAGLFPALEAAQGRPAQALKRLEDRFDAMLAQMQTAESAAATAALMHISSKDLRASLRTAAAPPAQRATKRIAKRA